MTDWRHFFVGVALSLAGIFAVIAAVHFILKYW